MGTRVYESLSSAVESNVNYLTSLMTGAEQNLFPKQYLKIDDQGDLVQNAPVDPEELADDILVSTLDEQEDLNAGENDFKYFTGTATIRIWLDGWDPHAFDAIFDQLLKIELQFEIK